MNSDLRRKVFLGQNKQETFMIDIEEIASNQRQFKNEQIGNKSLCKKMKKA
ncbi:unnamed protein product [Dovyalis caffra]|uniref:Uncharacterized protein n=1 Tax=Dovyalis caffra TaxID=77055 RepID=A0AAV1QRP2_9ROSI|nr:unnamed protein product [Dovyalis caffra]